MSNSQALTHNTLEERAIMKRTARYLSEEEEKEELEARRSAGPMTSLILLMAWAATELLVFSRAQF